MTQLGDGWPMVGRDAELDRLTRLLLDAESSDGPAVVVVEGELGVGKTRLLNEVADRGRARGFAVCGGGVSRQRLVRLARSGPVLLIVDDVPRAGRAAIDLVTSLVSEPRAARVAVLLACRTGGLPVGLGRALAGACWLRLPNLSARPTWIGCSVRSRRRAGTLCTARAAATRDTWRSWPRRRTRRSPSSPTRPCATTNGWAPLWIG